MNLILNWFARLIDAPKDWVLNNFANQKANLQILTNEESLRLSEEPSNLFGESLKLSEESLRLSGEFLRLSEESLKLSEEPLNLFGESLRLSEESLSLFGELLSYFGELWGLIDQELTRSIPVVRLAKQGC